jgi:predicted RNase H-like HicB family nuclease
MYPLNWPLSMFFASLGVPLLIKVAVLFDSEAGVYVATSPSVRGLVIEAATLDEIRTEVEAALPELLTLNHLDDELRGHKQTNLQFNTRLNAA